MIWLAGALKTRLGRLAAVSAAIAAALAAVWYHGYSAARKDANTDALENEVEAHERINDADTGDGLDDDERVKRLLQYRRHWRGD